MVVGKLDPTVGRICFYRIFQTVMNLEKRTTEMSSEGPKGGIEVWVGLKWLENDKIWRPKVAAAAVFAGPIRARPAAASREILRPRLSSGGAPPCPARVQ